MIALKTLGSWLNRAEQRIPVDRIRGFVTRFRWPLLIAAVIGGFGLYIVGLSKNPPGFYVDESGMAYNAYLIANTGAGEFGGRWPLFFQFYTGEFKQWANTTQIYLLAGLFRVFRPSILAARIYSAAWIFLASLLLGVLATQISRRRAIGVIVAITALLTPWLFEISRLVLDIFFYPMALVLFLLALYHAHNKAKWTWHDNVALAVALAFLTYTYTIGRLLAPLLAFGLLIFAINRQRLLGVLKTWGLYLLTLLPLIVFSITHPDLTERFYKISYINSETTLLNLGYQFSKRCLEDMSLISLLLNGDVNPRHHVQGSLGSVLLGTFILGVIGLFVVIVRHWRDPWWRFVLFGLAASLIPGALTRDAFHTLRLVAYPVFFLVMTVPALVWLFEANQLQPEAGSSSATKNREPSNRKEFAAAPSSGSRRLTLVILLTLTIAQATYFQFVFRREGPKRTFDFDSRYKEIFDTASAQGARPIYLVDGDWGYPAYIHAYWYATVEGRNSSEFVHLPQGMRPPAGVIVIGSEKGCDNCEIIMRKGVFLLYKTL